MGRTSLRTRRFAFLDGSELTSLGSTCRRTSVQTMNEMFSQTLKQIRYKHGYIWSHAFCRLNRFVLLDLHTLYYVVKFDF